MLWICCPAGFLDNNGSVAAIRLRDSPPILSSEEMIEQIWPQLRLWQQFLILLNFGSSFVLRRRPGKEIPVAGPKGRANVTVLGGKGGEGANAMLPTLYHSGVTRQERSPVWCSRGGIKDYQSGEVSGRLNQTSSLLLSCQGHHHPALRKPHSGLPASALANVQYTNNHGLKIRRLASRQSDGIGLRPIRDLISLSY
jgi:hypothetical protein